MAKGKKNSSLTSLLRYQKPKKKRGSSSQPSAFSKNRIMIGLVVVSVICSLAIGFWPNYSQKEKNIFQERREVTFEIIGDGMKGSNDKEDRKIREFISDSLSLADSDLESLAEKLLKKTQAGEVNIVQVGFSHFVVSIEARQPVMRIVADRLRYISNHGQVFGRATKDADKLTILENVLDLKRKKFKWNRAQILELSEDEKQRIKTARNLNSLAADMGFLTTHIRFVPFRGFEIRLSQNGTKILLGQPPFEKKLNKLSEILSELKEKSTQASLIELDFKGKAFIKERKL